MSQPPTVDPSLPEDIQDLIVRERRRQAAARETADENRRHAWNLGGQARPTRAFARTTRPEGVRQRPALLGGPPPRGRGPGAGG